MGYLYDKGLGVEKDRDEAIKYFQLGSGHGYLMCERSLIYLKYIKSTFSEKISCKIKLLKLMWKTFLVALDDENDERLSEIKLKGVNLELDEYKKKI